MKDLKVGESIIVSAEPAAVVDAGSASGMDMHLSQNAKSQIEFHKHVIENLMKKKEGPLKPDYETLIKQHKSILDNIMRKVKFGEI